MHNRHDSFLHKDAIIILIKFSLISVPDSLHHQAARVVRRFPHVSTSALLEQFQLVDHSVLMRWYKIRGHNTVVHDIPDNFGQQM